MSLREPAHSALRRHARRREGWVRDDELWHVAPRKAPHRASVRGGRGGDPATGSLVRPFAECVTSEPRSARLSRIHGFAPDTPQLAVAEPDARRRSPRLGAPLTVKRDIVPFDTLIRHTDRKTLVVEMNRRLGASARPRAVIRCATRLQRTCSSKATTFARSRDRSGTATWRRRWCIRTC
jgi:hypothetical protein